MSTPASPPYRTADGQRVVGKVAIVTGAGSATEGIGNGRAIALLLAQQGAWVCVVDREAEAAKTTVQMIEDAGGEAFFVEADVSRAEACDAIVAATVARWNRLDILVNNVGTSRIPGDAVHVDLDAWDQGMQVNVKSMVMMLRFAAPRMQATGGGSIINIASITAFHGGHPNLFYPTSKAAVVHLTRTMAGNHGAEGIRVNCVAPGFVFTPVVYGRGLPEGVREARPREHGPEDRGRRLGRRLRGAFPGERGIALGHGCRPDDRCGH